MTFLRFVGHLYFLMLPGILGGVANMVFMKLPVLKSWQAPIDGGRVLRDGRRVFGDNKTWKGFAGMIAFTAVFAWIFWHNWIHLSLLVGAWLGFAYVLFELPNSFVKRRLALQPGTNGGTLQTIVDLTDSVVGYILFFAIVHPLTWAEALGMLIIAPATHYIFNVLLFFVGLRGQKG